MAQSCHYQTIRSFWNPSKIYLLNTLNQNMTLEDGDAETIPEFIISSKDFKEGGEIPKNCGYKHGNKQPQIQLQFNPSISAAAFALIMDDPDAMGAVGKVWVHWLSYRRNDAPYPINFVQPGNMIEGKTDFGEIGYGGPAPPDKRHTYVFKAYALEVDLGDLKEGYSKQELEDAMEGFIVAEAKLTGTYAP